MKKLLILGCLLLAGCGESVNQGTVRLTVVPKQNYLCTINHDGHQFVVLVDGIHATGVIHHPGCPCLEKELK